MKKINESELKNRVNKLREYMSIVEGATAYVIKPGDTLGKIAAANRTSVADIMKLNPQIKDPNKIAAGASINISAGNQTAATQARTGVNLSNTSAGGGRGSQGVPPKAAAPAQAAAPAGSTTTPTPAASLGGQSFADANKAAIAAGAPAGTQPTTAPAGDAAKNPVGTTNAATAIPTGGLENPANQAKPAPTPAAPVATQAGTDNVENLKAQLASIKGTENEDPAIVKDLESRIAKAGQAQAAPPGEASYTPPAASTQAAAPANTTTGPAPGTVGTGAGGQLVDGSGKPVQQGSAQQPAQVGENINFQNDDLSRLVSLVHYR
jgi:LysM repeat protein